MLTDVHYFVKSRGHANFRLTLPEGTELWSAAVNGAAVVPVKDDQADLIPLPQQADPNAVLTIDLKLATRAKDPARVTVTTPSVGAPVMLSEWKLEPDTAQHLVYREGSLTPVGGVADVSGFAQLTRMFGGGDSAGAIFYLAAACARFAGFFAAMVWRSAARRRRSSNSACGHWMTPGREVAVAALPAGRLACVCLGALASEHTAELPHALTFLAPVQQAGNALSVEVDNLEERASLFAWTVRLWPALLAGAVFVYAWRARQAWWSLLGWTLLAWTALRSPNGADAFLIVLAAFFICRLALPALRRLWLAPRLPGPATAPGGGAASATAAILFALFIHTASAQDATLKETPVAETVTQQIRVEEKFAFATAKVHWQAVKGQRLPLIFEPAVLTKINYPVASLKLVQAGGGPKHSQQLLALDSGAFDIEIQYQVPVTAKDEESGLVLPAQFGLVNQLTLTLANLDVDVVSPKAVSIERKTAGKDTVATLVLSPANAVWVGWKPRSRDVANEKAVFYAELTQLYAPTAGVIEGACDSGVAIRPAPGVSSANW